MGNRKNQPSTTADAASQRSFRTGRCSSHEGERKKRAQVYHITIANSGPRFVPGAHARPKLSLAAPTVRRLYSNEREERASSRPPIELTTCRCRSLRMLYVFLPVARHQERRYCARPLSGGLFREPTASKSQAPSSVVVRHLEVCETSSLRLDGNRAGLVRQSFIL